MAITEADIHDYMPSMATPGTCTVCGLIRKNGRHPRDGEVAPAKPRDVRERQAGDLR